MSYKYIIRILKFYISMGGKDKNEDGLSNINVLCCYMLLYHSNWIQTARGWMRSQPT